MKTKLFLVSLMFMPLALFAADAAPSVPATSGDALNLLNLLITGLTPIVIFGIKKAVPNIPGFLLPVAAPVIGIALDFVLRKAGVETGGALAGALWGAAGVWLRELQDQTKQAIIPPTTTKTP